MLAKRMLIVVGTLLASAAAAAPASAGDRRIEVELGRGGIEVHADFRSGRDHRGGQVEVRGRHGRGGRHDDRGRRDHGDCCRVVPGHYEMQSVRVWVPGYTREEYVPPVYETRTDRHGRCHRVLVRPGYVRQVHVPGRYEIRQHRVWVPGRVVCRR